MRAADSLSTAYRRMVAAPVSRTSTAVWKASLSTQPPEILPATAPARETAITVPTGRGVEPVESMIVATAQSIPAACQPATVFSTSCIRTTL